MRSLPFPRRLSAPLALGLALALSPLSGCGRQAPAPAPASVDQPKHLYGGTASGQTPAINPHGKFWVDVQNDTRYAAALKVQMASGVNGNCAPILQQAIDDLNTVLAASVPANGTARGVVFLRAGTYGMAGGLDLDRANIELRGEGDSTILAANQGNSPLAIDLVRLGFCRTGTAPAGSSIAVDSTYRPDCFGVLDTVFAPSAGVRWGFRSKGVAFLNFQAHPFASGKASIVNASSQASDYWMESRAVTVDAAFGVQGGGNIPSGFQIMGAGDANRNNAMPFLMYGNGTNGIRCLISTQATPYSTPTSTILDATLTTTGLHRFTLQADMDAGFAVVWDNGVQLGKVAIPTTGFLNENKYYPFLVFSGPGTDRGGWGAPSGVDINLYGLCLSSVPRYQVLANGSTQTTIAGATTINDGTRYKPVVSGQAVPEANVLGWLRFTENPANNSRELFTPGGATAANGLTTMGYLCHNHQDANAATAAYVRLSDVKLQGNRYYGQNVAVAGPLHAYLTNVSSLYTANAFGAINMAANYTIRYEKCNASASDNAFYCFFSSVFVDDFNILLAGRTGMRIVGSVSDVKKVNTVFTGGGSQHLISYNAAAYGGQHTMTGLIADNEGNTYGRSAIYFEAPPYATLPVLQMKGLNLGTIGSVPTFEIVDGVGAQLSSIDIDGGTFGQSSAFVSSTSRFTYGTVKNVSYGDNLSAATPRFVSSNNAPALIVQEERYWTAPPRTLAWYQGAHRLLVPSAAPGQYQEWRCVASGTGDAAKWAGVNPLLTSPADLAAYLQNSSGNFAGSGTPTTIYVGLSTTPAVSISPSEPSGGGYARVAYTNSSGNWTRNLDGSKDNTNAIAFPTLSAPISAMSVQIYGASSGGTPLYSGDLPGTQGGQPRVLPSGSTPTFAPGALLSY